MGDLPPRLHHKCKTPKLVIFYDAQISRIKKKIHHVQGQKPSIKCAYKERESKLIVVRTQMYYLFPIENEKVILLSAVPISFYLLNFEYPFLMLQIVPFQINMKIKLSESVCIPLIFLEKGAASSSELLIYFLYNNHIQDSNLHWMNEIWMR